MRRSPLKTKAQRAWKKPERQRVVFPDVPPVVRAVILVGPRALGAAVPKVVPLRSEAYRRYVASFSCYGCGIAGYSQCAHENFGKAMSRKVCDSRTFPLCGPRFGLLGCHQQFDIGIDTDRETRRAQGAAYVERMQRQAVADGWNLETLTKVKA